MWLIFMIAYWLCLYVAFTSACASVIFLGRELYSLNRCIGISKELLEDGAFVILKTQGDDSFNIARSKSSKPVLKIITTSINRISTETAAFLVAPVRDVEETTIRSAALSPAHQYQWILYLKPAGRPCVAFPSDKQHKYGHFENIGSSCAQKIHYQIYSYAQYASVDYPANSKRLVSFGPRASPGLGLPCGPLGNLLTFDQGSWSTIGIERVALVVESFGGGNGISSIEGIGIWSWIGSSSTVWSYTVPCSPLLSLDGQVE
ncbi:hypothetical protein Tco_0530261 [Tanacetum coccineum]